MGILKTRIFLIGRRLFMYIETEDDFDFGRAFSAPAPEAARIREWDDIMRGFQEPGAGSPGRRMVGADGACARGLSAASALKV